MHPRLRAALAALLLVAGLFGVGIWIDDDGDGWPDRQLTDRGFRTIADPPGPAAPVVADRDQQLEADEVAEAAKSPADRAGNIDLHEDTRDETPPGVTRGELERGQEKTEQLVEKERLQPQRPAGAQNYRCVSRPVGNQSALSGQWAIRGKQWGVALHFTVSDPGSLFTIRDLFNRPSFGASSNYGWDWAAPRGEYCHVWVRVGRKAWAQGPANSAYVSIEIHTRDRSRASWIANLKDGRLAALVRDLLAETGAPIRLVDPVGCVFPPGLTDHDRIECGMTHWDVGKNFPWDVFLRLVRAGAAPNPLTPKQQKACDTLNWHRRRAHTIGRWYPSRRARAEQLKRQIPKGRCPSRYRGEPGRH